MLIDDRNNLPKCKLNCYIMHHIIEQTNCGHLYHVPPVVSKHFPKRMRFTIDFDVIKKTACYFREITSYYTRNCHLGILLISASDFW